MTSHFGSVPFAVGSIRGERSWEWDGEKLKSPQFPHTWAQGENESRCLRRGGETIAEVEEGLRRSGLIAPDAILKDVIVNGFGPGGRVRPTGRDVVECTWVRPMRARVTPGTLTMPPHWMVGPGDIAEMTTDVTGTVTIDTMFFQNLLDGYRRGRPHTYKTCVCGFYAYLNGFNEYNHADRVTGVIEGYGETLIGTRGFRAQKARILALAPGETEVAGEDWNVTTAAALNASMQHARAAMKAAFRREDRSTRISNLRRAYPDIPVFDTLLEMRLEFPPTDVKEVMG